MAKKLWVKAALFAASGTMLAIGLGFPGGCLDSTVQRILTAVAID